MGDGKKVHSSNVVERNTKKYRGDDDGSEAEEGEENTSEKEGAESVRRMGDGFADVDPHLMREENK